MTLQIFFRIFLRNLKERLIPLIGLSVAMMVVVFSISYIIFELSYDKYHRNSDRIYTVQINIKHESGKETVSSYTSHNLFHYINNRIPLAEVSCRTVSVTENLKTGNDIYRDQNALYIDPGFFEIFDFRTLKGTVARISETSGAILSEGTSQKLFGISDPLGNIIEFQGRIYEVIAVVSDAPANSNISFDILLPAENYMKDNDPGRFFLAVKTFILTTRVLDDYSLIEDQMTDFYRDIGNESTSCRIVPLSELHQKLSRSSENFWAFILVSALVLFVSIVNYINMFTAYSEKKLRESGIRRALGSRKSELLRTLVAESILTCVLATVTGMILSELGMNYFRNLADININQYGPGLFRIHIILAGLAVIIGAIAGLIPSLRISDRNISLLLKGNNITGRLGIPARKILLTFQFAISLGIIIFLIVVLMQVRYLNYISPGFNPENRLLIPLSRSLALKYESFSSEISALPGVENVTAKTSPFGSQYGADIKLTNKTGDEWIKATGFSVHDGFFETMGMEMLEGKTFVEISGRDSSLFIVDENTAALLGFDNALGKYIMDDFVWGEIIGVVKEATLLPLRGEPRPVIYNQIKDYYRELIIHYSGDIRSLTSSVGEVLRKFDSEYIFEYQMMDEVFRGFYSREFKFFRMILWSGIIAIILSLAGSYSMSVYLAERRRKSVCIRKIHGASIKDVLQMSARELVWMILFAFIFSSPVSYIIGIRWLGNYSEHINIGFIPFILALLILSVMVFMTVYFKERQSALANPVDNLRQE